MQTVTEIQAAIDAIDTKLATMVANADKPGAIMSYKIGEKSVSAKEAFECLQARREYLQNLLSNFPHVISERFDYDVTQFGEDDTVYKGDLET